MVLERIPAGHAADQRRPGGHAPQRSHALARLRIGRVARQVIAIGDHHHARAVVAMLPVARSRILRRAHDGRRQARRQPRAQLEHQPRGTAAAIEMFAGIADPPCDRADAGQPRGHAADQVGVVHPGLHGVGTFAPQQRAQGQQAAQRDAAARHAQRMHRHPGGAQARAIDPFVGQRDHTVAHPLVRPGGEPEQDGFGAALAQAGDHVHDAQDPRHAPPRTRSNSASHCASTAGSA
ncbi:Uncharacterised protein [Bordetella pertussis]|nr:Uncharacterised protein [Bordetella pertussis]CFN24930.1 Uncharacterised protein [Bordetella pertussis]CFT83268.1 Uncharacterised protein [Bordetella pertussis]CPK18523.1 Uncharacterised protein [Bordetella pertussis]CPL33431.1 Uncharacterised protein [Bordetella pertussis]